MRRAAYEDFFCRADSRRDDRKNRARLMSVFKGVGLCLDYGRKRAVDNLNLRVESGVIFGLLGPNGAGKTSTFYMMVGLIHPRSGRVILDDVDVTDLPLDRRARRGVAYLPQEPSAFRDLTTEDNILAVLEFQSLSRKERIDRCARLLQEMGLEHVAKNRARWLSGGERRRLEIARALAITPKFLLLDEPFAGVDPKQVSELQEMILKLKEEGIGILITDHNVHEMLDVVDMATIIYDGCELKSGRGHELVKNADVIKHYLGENFRWAGTREEETPDAH